MAGTLNTRYTEKKLAVYVMPLIILLFFMLLLPASQASESLILRLEQAAGNAEQVGNQLLSQSADTLSSEDWLVLAETQLRLRNKEAAMSAVSHALESTVPPYLQAHGYLLKAQIYGILYRDTMIAITQLQQAELLLQHAEDDASLALYSDVLQNFAQAYNQLGNIPQAIPYAERSLALAVRQQQPEAELKARITLGRLTLQNNAYSQAYQHLNQALVLATRLKDDDALASIHLRLGMAYRKIKHHSQALQHLLLAKQRYQQLERHSNYTFTLIYIGETFLEDRNTAAEAASYLTEALTLARKLDDLPRVGVATLGLGRLAVLQQQEELALQYFNEAQQLFRQQNVQTYLQETNLELAELLLQRQQYQTARQLLQELDVHMPQAAAYLRHRYYDLTARIYAQQGDWAQAYRYYQQATVLRVDEQTAQNKLQLDMMDLGLKQASASQQLQADLSQMQQLNFTQQRDIYLLFSAILLLLLTLAGMFIWSRQRQSTAGKAVLQLTPDWNSFCQSLQQHSGKEEIALLACSPASGQQIKMHHGEQYMQQMLQNVLQQLPAQKVRASCNYDDVLWLAVSGDQDDVAALQSRLLQLLQQRLPSCAADQPLLCLQLPLQQLLQRPWRILDLTALRETFWLSRALCPPQSDSNQHQTMVMYSSQPGACEWCSSMVRQDLLNAIRLGSIWLTCNGTALPATIADGLS
jgi:tetratricopeptide (TPR) repeat protein